MPTLAVRELVYCTDEQALYIGTAAGNIKLCAAALEGIVNSINGTVNAHGQSISSLQNSVNGLNNNLNSFSGTLSQHQQGITNLNTEMYYKLTANKVQAQAGLANEATLPQVITAVNNLIAAMKASGVMNN